MQRGHRGLTCELDCPLTDADLAGPYLSRPLFLLTLCALSSGPWPSGPAHS